MSASSSCKHEESLYGRCTACGKTWAQQEIERARLTVDRFLRSARVGIEQQDTQ